METNVMKRYWSFSFWLRKSIWLGLSTMAAWMVWQFILRHADIAKENVIFTNTLLRFIGGIIFAYLFAYFAIRLIGNWKKDAILEQPFSPSVDVLPVINPIEETNYGEVPGLATPPPFEVKDDDLTQVSGIGSAMSQVLNVAGITSYAVLANQSVEQLETILTNAGENFRFHDPASWPSQARSIIDGQWSNPS